MEAARCISRVHLADCFSSIARFTTFAFRVSGIYTSRGDCVFIAKQAAVVWPIRGRDAYEYDFLIEFNPAVIFEFQ